MYSGSGSRLCNESNFTDVYDSPLCAGRECAVLAADFGRRRTGNQWKYEDCSDYCAAQSLECAGAQLVDVAESGRRPSGAAS